MNASDASTSVIALPAEPPRARQEFPPSPNVSLASENIDLASLVHHREAVDANLSLEHTQLAFRSRGIEFMAVLRDRRVIGLCARGKLGFIMSSRFGFAIYSQHPIETALVDQPLVIVQGTAIREVLDRALSRQGDAFHEDVVLVDSAGGLIGLMKVETLAQLQSRLVAEQLARLQAQHDELRRQHLALFEANHAARQSHGLYLGLFASHTLGVALLDNHGTVHDHNDRFAELLNLRRDPVALLSLAHWVVPEQRDAFLMLLDSHARGAVSASTHEFQLAIAERGPRLFRCSTGWIRETGQICVCLDDITEQRALERNLLRQEKQTLLDTLVGGIAHELNNKLTPIQGFVELLGIEATPRTAAHLEIISKSVGEAARIIAQLLELSKPAGHSARLVDLRTTVEETLAILKFQLRDFRCEVRRALPSEPVWVTADPAQLKQVAINLVINALHAMEEVDRPVLTIEIATPADQVELRVTDNGCGIAPENLTRIFDPFFTTKGPERGTGLGLSICFSIARQHGGDIAVKSQLGIGTVFTFSLHREIAPPALNLPPAAISVGETAAAGIPRGRRVLVVEDEVVLRRLMHEILSARFGCRVETATTGAEALTALDKGSFDLILSDIRMPTMNGTEFYLWLREIRPELARRFVFITGHPGDQDLRHQIAQWGVPVIAKPFKLATLVEVCAPFLQSPELADAAS